MFKWEPRSNPDQEELLYQNNIARLCRKLTGKNTKMRLGNTAIENSVEWITNDAQYQLDKFVISKPYRTAQLNNIKAESVESMYGLYILGTIPEYNELYSNRSYIIENQGKIVAMSNSLLPDLSVFDGEEIDDETLNEVETALQYNRSHEYPIPGPEDYSQVLKVLKAAQIMGVMPRAKDV